MADTTNSWPALPTETEIYILPNGEIVVADLPAELAAQLSFLSPANLEVACVTPVPATPIIDSGDTAHSHVTDQ